MLRRLRPYGPCAPKSLSRAGLTAYLMGIRDGWEQPYDLSSSANVEHLPGDQQEALDRGINLGQWLRSPLNHQHPWED